MSKVAFRGKISRWLGRRHKPLIGLDVSSSAVKLLELVRDGNHYRVQSFAATGLPPNAVTEKQITDPEVVGKVIAGLVRQSGTHTRDAAIAVAGSSVITKVIQMPASLKDEEIEQQIRFEADQHIPYPVEEVNLDFQVLGPNDKDPHLADILLVACRSDTVEIHQAALELAGLRAAVVDVEAYALETACRLLTGQMPNEGRGRVVAIVDLGATTTLVNILSNLDTIYMRDQLFGGVQLTEEIMRRYGLSMEEAGRAKKAGRLPKSYEDEVLPAFQDDLVQQIERSLQFFFSANGHYEAVDQILLSGGCANIPDIDHIVQQELGTPTAIARPFSEMRVAPRVNSARLEGEGPTMLIACGLALRAFD